MKAGKEEEKGEGILLYVVEDEGTHDQLTEPVSADDAYDWVKDAVLAGDTRSLSVKVAP